MQPVHASLAFRRRGTALILVLSCLALLSILAVAFISSVTIEVESSSNYASGSDVKQVSVTAVNMVMAQIQQAASEADTTWASQPGLINTYGLNGEVKSAYKLYSSDTMVVAKGFDPNIQIDVPSDWKSRPTEFVDLNQPILVNDPAGLLTRGGERYTPNYPILDPGALGTVKGFSINGVTSAPDYSAIDPTVNNPAPMPVRWLYLLKDGSFRALSPTGNLPGATADNPPVARVAFWTDDETCKVNINTAAGDEWDSTSIPGTFVDMPRTKSQFDDQVLSANQPLSHEYQRYPGHPATTYLTAVFPHLKRKEIADIVPRINDGGSKGGTVNTLGITTGLPFSDGMPLYATVDELRYVRSTSTRTQEALFPARSIETSKFFLTASSRAPEVNLLSRPRIALWPEPADPANRTSYDNTVAFCATVAGAPFYFVRGDATSPTADYAGQPRNIQLYEFLQNWTSQPIPGFGGAQSDQTFLKKYPIPSANLPSERDQILTEIFDYVRGNINLLDTTAGAKTYAGNIYAGDLRTAPSGTGHVVPIQIGDTRGFGRSMTVFSPILLLAGLEAEVLPKAPGAPASLLPAVDSNGDSMYVGPGERARNAYIGTKTIQALLLMDMFSPSHGPVRFVPNLLVKVTGLDDLKMDGVPMGFPANAEINFNRYANNHEYAWGGYVNHAGLFFDRGIGGPDQVKKLGTGPLDYQAFSSIISLANKEYKKGTLAISGGNNIYVEFYAKNAAGSPTGDWIQRIKVNFPDVTVPVPTVRGIYKHSYTASASPSIPIGAKIPKFPDAILACTSALDAPGLVNSGYNSGNIEFQTMFHVSRSLVPFHGDMRLVMGRKEPPEDLFVRGRGYDPTVPAADLDYHKLWRVQDGEEKSGGMVGAGPTTTIGGNHYSTSGKLVASVTYDQHILASTVRANDRGPSVHSNLQGAYLQGRNGGQYPGDWDTGMGGVNDGPYIGKADEGERGSGAYRYSNATISISSLFSPNRQVPSPVVLGSLSTGVVGGRPWQTLLFCPNPAAGQNHPGFGAPEDHLWLDLFWMPVVEPYAISEPFSTAGKINMNYQIVPFTNIERSTALHALLRSTRVTAIPTTSGMTYKSGGTGGAAIPDLFRHQINIVETLKGFEERFANNDPFRSATEICKMFLVPDGVGATFNNIESWWDGYKLTGDNLRENPYSHLYSRLTTKSNTFTVHTRVQLLKKAPISTPGTWDENKDKVLGESRTSYTIERYLDPSLTSYDPMTPLTAYKFRTLATKKFTP